MNPHPAAALRSRQILRAVLRGQRPRERTFGDSAFVAYASVLVALVTLAPAARAVWLLRANADVHASIAAFPLLGVGWTVALLLCGAVWLGTIIPPAARSPLATSLLAHGPLTRPQAFAAPVLRAVLLAAVVGSAAGGVLGVLGAAVTAIATALWAALGLGAGICAGVLMLIGQRFPREARLCASVGAAAALLGMSLPLHSPALVSTPVPELAVLACALGVVCLSLVPWLLRGLGTQELIDDAARAFQLREHATAMDTAAVSRLTTLAPLRGRGLRALPRGPVSLWLVFLRRDAVAALRSPERVILSVAVLAASVTVPIVAAGATPLAAGSGMPTGLWLWTTLSGMLAFLALGGLAPALRHAADSVSGLGVYGGGRLLTLLRHAWMPMIAAVLAMIAVCAMSGCSPIGGAGAVAITGGLLCQIMHARKGDMPIALLTPIPTEMGDMAMLLRLGWAADALLASAVIGASSAAAPALAALLCVAVALLAWRRWHRD